MDILLWVCLYLDVWFGFRRFVLRYEAVHAAVGPLPVVTSAFKEMRLAQSCTQTQKHSSQSWRNISHQSRVCMCVYKHTQC